jgi:adenine-specific DNA-methyltransferase
MELIYKNKKPVNDILKKTAQAVLFPDVDINIKSKNLLIKGDNQQVMQALIKKHNLKGSVDLVYIDPPFSTDTVFRHSKERTSTISPSRGDIIAYSDKMKEEEYLEFIRERLVFIKELMSDHASIYFHIDYKIGHYIKIIMDEVFGKKNFRNDITRIKCNPKNFARKGYSNIKDMVLFFTKNDHFIWNEPRQPMTQEELERLFSKVDKNGRKYTTTPLHAPGETQNGRTGQSWKGMMPPRGRHWRYDPSVLDKLEREGLIEWSGTGNPRKMLFADDAIERGKRLQDIWDFKDRQYPLYPTEKNPDFLKTIVLASSNEGQVVFDCFCGSGTTLVAAQSLNRRWIGIDNSQVAIDTTTKRLKDQEKGLFEHVTKYLYLEQQEEKIDFQKAISGE